jgi:DNA-binding transcriptional MocR family regulator
MTPSLSGLDYRGFLAWRSVYGGTIPHRLDGMDIVEGLPHLDPAPRFATLATSSAAAHRGVRPAGSPRSCPLTEATTLALATLTLPPEWGARIVPTTGVRAALAMVFEWAAARGDRSVVLPCDVYPVYGRLAHKAGLTVYALPTLPVWDVVTWVAAAIRTQSHLLLLPAPLVPLGRDLAQDEEDTLAEWLADDQRRRLVLDTVYRPDPSVHSVTARLLRTEQVILVHSISKSHLAPDTLGYALMPSGQAEDLRANALPVPPDGLQRAAALVGPSATAWGRELPGAVRAAVERRWEHVAPLLRRIAPTWTPPRSGYYGLLSLPPDVLRDAGVLGIPATVFGSGDATLTVVSCLPPLGAV